MRESLYLQTKAIQKSSMKLINGSRGLFSKRKYNTHFVSKNILMVVRAHLYISGRVQGVFFRDSVQRLARKLKVVGWVRNLPDGRVEAVFEGDEENVKRMIEFCKRGPPAARVDDVKVIWEKPSGEFDDFEIRW